MKLSSLFYLLIAGVLVVAACERPPELPSVPIISFESVQYKQVPDRVDTLILTLGFEDNEGDLGVNISSKDNVPDYYYPTDANGNYITLGSSPDLPPYHVCDYVINPTINGVLIEDTVLIKTDENYNNIFLTFYRKVRGEFELFDFRTQLPSICFSFDGRFLRLNSQPQDRPLVGSLTYRIPSHMFGTIFRVTDTLKIEVQIRDNAFNYSNVIETPEFTLEGVKAN
jgi:hypothetical protein